MADNQNIQTPHQASKGMHTDNNYINQPEGTYRYALNAVNETRDGNQNSLSTEGANYSTDDLPGGYAVIGDVYMTNEVTAVILTSYDDSRQQIGVVDQAGKYIPYVDTGILGMSIKNQADIEFRLRKGNQRVIYWVDGDGFAKTFNFDRPHNFYSEDYKFYLKAGGNPDTYAGEKWDLSSFNLIKTYSTIPEFNDVEIIENGSIPAGSYNFAIGLVDEDLNPTGWITTSNTVNIFNDTITNTFERIRGSKNVDNSAQSFPRANKSIKLTIGNLDTSFPYYRVAIIRANKVTGVPDEVVLVSDLQPTTNSTFIYSGNDDNLTRTSLGDILIDSELVYAPKHIEQLENKLILLNGKGKSVNFCEFQEYASKIAANLTTKEVILNSVLSEGNIKNAKSTFFYSGYMPGEVHAFNVHYVFTDNYISPGFHIPGKSVDDVGSLMKHYEIESRYLDLHNCSTENYWGFDNLGDSLVGKKVRHHRFPFRHEVNKPLYTRNTSGTDINKYRLKVEFTLNPAWTPGPIEYPTSGSDPIVIPYRIEYKVGSSPTSVLFSGSLTDSDMGNDIVIYDDITPLADVSPGIKGELDPTSQLAVTYQSPGNDRFILTFTYETYLVDTVSNSDVTEIFGIEFSNIERPHPDVIGFFITRAEKLDDDRLILDNAVFGPMTEFNNYKSFGLLTPKQFYLTNNCGVVHNAGKTLQYYDKGVWFFNPQFQFNNKKDEFSRVEVEGVYSQTTVQMPTISNTDGQPCNNLAAAGNSKGVYVEDVQAGTSYNPEVNTKKDKDDDGFDLLVGYRNTNMSFALSDTVEIPAKKRVVYLNAASYQTVDSDILYNVSVDNKIGIYATNDDIDLNPMHNGSNENGLIYGSLVRDSNVLYSNFLTRPYYKEHNNPIYFGDDDILNGVEIFNGDAKISALNIVSSVFYDMVVADRPKKSGLWKIILGAVLIVAGVVVGIFTGGAGLTISAVGAAVLAGLAISYGVSLAMSGIKFEQFKKMVDVDYEKGLKETVVDGGVFETVRDIIDKSDDTIRWFTDRVSNIYIESPVPFGLRSGLTAGVPDFVDAPDIYDEAGFRSYLIEKFTVVDRDQGSGRLYKGYPTAEFYDINPDYGRFNKQKVFISLPIEYDCCTDKNEEFPMRVWWSEQSFQEENVDNYRVFLPNNYKDIEGEHGEITNAYRMNNSLFIHTKEALWHLPQNNQERITDGVVSYIGTGEFFSIPPVKVIDGDLGYGGCSDKWGTQQTSGGVVFVSAIDRKIYLHSDGISDISSRGMSNDFKNNLVSFLEEQLYESKGEKFLLLNNPANPSGVGYLSVFDTRYDRVIITKKDYRIVDRFVDELTVVTEVFPNLGFTYNKTNGKFYIGDTHVLLTNSVYFENKSFTVSFSLHTGTWVSYHSYLPDYYIHGHNHFYATTYLNNSLWRFNSHTMFKNFFGTSVSYIVERVHAPNPMVETTFEDLSVHTEAKIWNNVTKNYMNANLITFDSMIAYNTKQSTGRKILIVKESQSFEEWIQNQTADIITHIIIEKDGNYWRINDFRDQVVDHDLPIFTSEWNQILGIYPIDKVPNYVAISFLKDWWELEMLRDKFIVVRLEQNNFDNARITIFFTIDTTKP